MKKFSMREVFCCNHMNRNEIWCITDEIAICPQCVTSHASHILIHLNDFKIPNEFNDNSPYSTDKFEIILQRKKDFEFEDNSILNISPISTPLNHVDFGIPQGLQQLSNLEIATKENSSLFLEKEIMNRNSNVNNKNNKNSNLNFEWPQNNFFSDTNIQHRSKFNSLLNYKENPEEIINIIENHYKLSDLSFLQNEERFLKHKNKVSLERKFSFGKTINPLIIKFDNDPFTIYLYDILNSFGKKINLKNFMIPPDSAITYCNENLFVTGGKNESNFQNANCYALDLIKFTTTKCKNMNVEKRNHSIISIENLYIYSIGGYNKKNNYLNIVEKYEIENDTWNFSKPISFGRQDISLCKVNEKYLYAFGGAIFEYEIWNYSNIIERLNTEYDLKGWEVIALSTNEGWSPRIFSGIFQILVNKLIIFGGFDSNIKDDVFIMDIDKNQIFETKIKLRNNSSFIQRNSNIIQKEGFIYTIGYPNKDIFRYSINESNWNYLDSSKWFNFE